MSWSIHFIGRPAAIAHHAKAYGQTLNDKSRGEYKAALLPILALLDQNQNDMCYQLSASGHAYVAEGGRPISTCIVSLQSMGDLVELPKISQFQDDELRKRMEALESKLSISSLPDDAYVDPTPTIPIK